MWWKTKRFLRYVAFLSTEHVRCDVTLNVKIKKNKGLENKGQKNSSFDGMIFFLRAHTVYVSSITVGVFFCSSSSDRSLLSKRS